MTQIDENLRCARIHADQYERTCERYGVMSAAAQNQRGLVWRHLVDAVRELALEMGDVTAGLISSDEVSCPDERYGRAVCALVDMARADLVAEGRGGHLRAVRR